MWRIGSALLFGALLVQDAGDAASDKARLHDELAAAAEITGDQLLKLKAWDEARAFLELIRAKSDARAEALDKLIARTDKQTSGLKWDAKSSELIKTFGAERAKPFLAFARTWKERDPEATRWTEAEGQILADFLDYVKAYARLTQIRAHYELPKTRFDWKLSVPAVWHAHYELLNPDDPEEVEGKPGFTHEGKRTRSKSLVSQDETLSELLEGLIHAPYYRNYVLHPALAHVGCGQVTAKTPSSVIDVRSGISSDSSGTSFLATPKDKAENVATTGYDDHVRVVKSQSMKSLGYPISIAFFSSAVPPTNVSARLTERMKDIPCYLSTPESPLVDSSVPHIKSTIAIVPKEPLRPKTEYRIAVRFTAQGAEKKMEWTFTTAR